jgi:hypothetical protein
MAAPEVAVAVFSLNPHTHPSSSFSIESTSRLNNRLLELLIDPATPESDKTAVADKPPLNS